MTDAFERELAIVLAATGDRDAALATAARTEDGDADSWVLAWTEHGGAAWAAARERPTAALFMEAAVGYGAALADR
jgi:hypothetical protein